MKSTFFKIAAASAIAAASLQAQPTRAAMESITMPAPHYNKTDNLDYPGDWGYWTVGTLRTLGGNANLGNPSLWNWVRYTNTGNAKEVWAMAAINYNVCNHAHISYGLWGKLTMSIAGITSSSWTRLGMGTQSGVTVNNQCKWDVDNIWVQTDPKFGWGTNYMTGNIKGFPFKYAEFVVGILGISHGGACGGTQCAYPVTSYLWTIP